MALSFFQNVQPKAGTPGVAQPSGSPPDAAPAGGQPPNMLFTVLPFLILVPFLFISFRRQKKEAEARKSLKRGDRVVSQAGLIGDLVDLDDRVAKVKIAPGTTVQILASALAPFEASAEKSKSDGELNDLKEAKATADKK